MSADVLDDRLRGAMQENVLTVLCFDDERAPAVRMAVGTAQVFESAIFREVAGVAIDFLDRYGEAVKDHLPDHFEHVLNGDDARKAAACKRLLDNLFLARESVNGEYVLSELRAFVYQQHFKSGLIKSAEAIEAGNVDAAVLAMQTALSMQVSSFDAGLDMSDPATLAALVDNPDEPGFDLGIPELDLAGVIPRRKQLFLFIAPRSKGKSWFAIHCAKYAVLQRWSVLIITLEMSERQYAVRVVQSFLSVTTRKAQTRVARLVLRDGRLDDVVDEMLDRPSLSDEVDRPDILARAREAFTDRASLRIKEFATQSLTMEMLEAYLDALERHAQFTPDCLIVDYPDLFKHDGKEKRTEVGAILERLRGIGVKRNCAVVALSQSNRESERVTTVTSDLVAEDISKVATADNAITHSQTRTEKKLGLARLLVEKARNHRDKFMVLVTQAYEIGQFCLESVGIGADYWDVLEQSTPSRAPDEAPPVASPPPAPRARARRT